MPRLGLPGLGSYLRFTAWRHVLDGRPFTYAHCALPTYTGWFAGLQRRCYFNDAGRAARDNTFTPPYITAILCLSPRFGVCTRYRVRFYR